MKIQAPNINLNNSFSRINFKTYNSPSFSSQDNNSKDSVDVCKRILSLDYDELNIPNIQSYIPNIPLKSAKNINMQNCSAVFSYDFSPKGNLSDFTIYIPELICQNKKAKTVFVMNLAHEYTHFLQTLRGFNSDKILYDTIKQKGYDNSVFFGLHDSAQKMYELLGGQFARQAVEEILKDEGTKSYIQNHGLILLPCEISQDDIARVFEFSSNSDFIKRYKNNIIFQNHLQKTLNECSKLGLKDKKEGEDLILAYIKNRSREEQQACFSENQIAHIQCFDDKASEIAYKYYGMLEKAMA